MRGVRVERGRRCGRESSTAAAGERHRRAVRCRCSSSIWSPTVPTRATYAAALLLSQPDRHPAAASAAWCRRSGRSRKCGAPEEPLKEGKVAVSCALEAEGVAAEEGEEVVFVHCGGGLLAGVGS